MNYKKEFLDYASKIDALTNSYCEVSKIATNITEETSDKSIFFLCKKISELNKEFSKTIEEKSIIRQFYTSFVEYIGHRKIELVCSKEPDTMEDNRTLEQLLEELNELVGLTNVKSKVQNLIAYQHVRKMREEHNLKNASTTLHMAFTGNPGTGKTTVARIIGHIYKKLGLLSRGHFTEVSRTDLIAGYQGQTALKVKAVIEKAIGGVLFIDEAYSITENDSNDAYGKECLTELTKALEDYRKDLVVIVAGYTKPMEKFFESNNGLKSRFNTFIEFLDYNVEELEKILEVMCSKNDYQIDESLREKVHQFFLTQISENSKNFSNGRLVRNLYDNLVMQQALRIANMNLPSVQDLKTFKLEDFPCFT